MMQGVALHPLRQIPDERGAVLHMLRASDPHYERFGEIYFSTIRHGAVKAWHKHKTKTVNLAVPIGCVRVVIFGKSDRPAEIVLGREDYQLLTIHPGLWYGFKGLAEGESLLANCATEPFSPTEGEDLPCNTDRFPYSWDQP